VSLIIKRTQVSEKIAILKQYFFSEDFEEVAYLNQVNTELHWELK